MNKKKLFVANLASTLNCIDLEEIFTTVGDVESVYLPTDSATGERCTFGYIEMTTVQGASDCIERFHGMNIRGKTLAVVHDVPKVVAPVPLLTGRKKAKRWAPPPRVRK